MNPFQLMMIFCFLLTLFASYKLYPILKKVPQLATNNKALWTVLVVIDLLCVFILLQVLASLLFWIQWLVLGAVAVGIFYAVRWLRGSVSRRSKNGKQG